MICKKCGKYNPDHNQVCMYCGNHMKGDEQGNFYKGPTWQQPQQPVWQAKTGVGIFFCLVLGIIGLILGLLLYPYGTYERETFISGWVKCFVVSIIVSVMLAVMIVCIITY